jgi:hypothetical protein
MVTGADKESCQSADEFSSPELTEFQLMVFLTAVHAEQAQRRALDSNGCVLPDVVNDGNDNMPGQRASFINKRLVKFEVGHML